MATLATFFRQPGTVFRARTEARQSAPRRRTPHADPWLSGPTQRRRLFLQQAYRQFAPRASGGRGTPGGEWSAIAGVCYRRPLLIGGMMIAPGVAGIMRQLQDSGLEAEQASCATNVANSRFGGAADQRGTS